MYRSFVWDLRVRTDCHFWTGNVTFGYLRISVFKRWWNLIFLTLSVVTLMIRIILFFDERNPISFQSLDVECFPIDTLNFCLFSYMYRLPLQILSLSRAEHHFETKRSTRWSPGWAKTRAAPRPSGLRNGGRPWLKFEVGQFAHLVTFKKFPL
jgi:hypothetical protein